MWTAEWLEITPHLRIPLLEISFSFARSGGPGGQNVNKTETKVLLSFDITTTPSLDEGTRQKLLQKLKNRIDNDGILRLSAQRFRSQHRNRTDALERLQALLQDALVENAERKPTRPSYGMIQRRLEVKKLQSARKRDRTWRGDE